MRILQNSSYFREQLEGVKIFRKMKDKQSEEISKV